MRARANLLVVVVGVLGCGAGELRPFATGAAADGTGDGSASEASGTPADSSGGDAIDPGPTPRGIVYVRCPRTLATVELEGDVETAEGTRHVTRTLGYTDVYDQLPRPTAFAGFVAPCDLVLRTDDGEETTLFDCSASASPTRTCAATEPAVSHDGRKVAFSLWWGPIDHHEMRMSPPLLDPAATGGEERWLDLPNPALAASDAALHVIDLGTFEDVALPHEAGSFDVSPTFLADGRLAFGSTRAGHRGPAMQVAADPYSTSTIDLVPQLYTIATDGRDLRAIGVHGLTGDLDPFQLRDGRVAFVSRQLFGMLPYRYDNGSPGSPGAIGSSWHVYAVDPDGARLTAMFGQHTHTSGSADFTHVASQGIAQASDGTLWVGEAAGPFGAGRIYSFTPRDDGREGLPAGGDVEVGDVLRPEDLDNVVPWAGRSGLFSGPMPAPAVELPGYDDPIVYRGFVRDPEALPDGGMLATWTKGACGDVAVADESLFGVDPPPLTSGSGAFTAMNALDLLGFDSPGCDAGIVRMPTGRSEHPSDLEIVVDTVEFHEIMPRRVAPYADVHGVAAPTQLPAADERADAPEHLPEATPFALFGASSLRLRETRSIDGHPFGSLVQWALQGTDTSDYGDDEICGLRLLAVQPGGIDEEDLVRTPAGLRTLVLAEVPAGKRDEDGEVVLDPTGVPDTSVRLRVPADVPLIVQGIDCLGRTLSSSQTPMSLRPGEDLRCDGCHVRSQPGLPFADTAAAQPDFPIHAAGGGTVQLLAGGVTNDVAVESHDGWGLAYEFERDVWPLLQSRCVSCHGGDAPAAGLPLDVAGIEPGSTWWRLAADFGQSQVPDAQRIPGGTLRKPQISRYVRFMAARGSLLYWKAANARTDGRSDDDVADDAPEGQADVDFGADHPTDITDAELAVLGRWIDTGAAAGAPVQDDGVAPALRVVLDPDDPSRLLVGTVDVGVGIDPDSLEVCSVAASGSCTTIAAPAAALAGVVEVPLSTSGSDLELRIRVRDRAGNETVVQRVLAMDAMPADTDDGSTDDASDDSDTSADQDDDGKDPEGCGCGSAPPGAGVLAILVVVACRRRLR